MASWLWAHCRAPHSTNKGGQLRKQAYPGKMSRRRGADTCRPQPGGIFGPLPTHSCPRTPKLQKALKSAHSQHPGSRNPSHVAGEDGGGTPSDGLDDADKGPAAAEVQR